MTEKKISYDLYMVTDPFLAGDQLLKTMVEAALRGGASIIQYRDKRNISTRELIREASVLLEITRRYKVPLIVNDRLDVALAIGADGIHLGQDDLPIRIARKFLRGEKIIGVSVRSTEEARLALEEKIDYLAISGIFSTQTKMDVGMPLGLERIKEIAQITKIPIVAIGGITLKNAASVIEAGASGIAVVSAILSSCDPQRSAGDLVRVIKEARIR